MWDVHYLVAVFADEQESGILLDGGNDAGKNVAAVRHIGNALLKITRVAELLHLTAADIGIRYALDIRGEPVIGRLSGGDGEVKALVDKRHGDDREDGDDQSFHGIALQLYELYPAEDDKHRGVDAHCKLYAAAECERDGDIENQPRENDGDAPELSAAVEKLIYHEAGCNIEPDSGDGAVSSKRSNEVKSGIHII